MNKPVLLRKRFIPDEVVNISGDELLFRSNELLVTRWKSIKPRADLSGGISYTFLNEGIKIGRFYDADKNFLYWYCDIINVIYNVEKDTYILEDLLVDVKIMPDGTLKVLDMDELAEALESRLISVEQACVAMRNLDKLLKLVYDGKFPPEECSRYEY